MSNILFGFVGILVVVLVYQHACAVRLEESDVQEKQHVGDSVKAIFFDFDQTISQQHMYHIFKGRNASSYQQQKQLANTITQAELETIFGGAQRIQHLLSFLGSLYQRSMPMGICTFGYAGAVADVLQRLDMKRFFDMGIKGAETSIRCAGKKYTTIRAVLKEKGFDGVPVISENTVLFVDDDPRNIQLASTQSQLQTYPVIPRSGVQKVDMDAILAMAESKVTEEMTSRQQTMSAEAMRLADRASEILKNATNLNKTVDDIYGDIGGLDKTVGELYLDDLDRRLFIASELEDVLRNLAKTNLSTKTVEKFVEILFKIPNTEPSTQGKIKMHDEVKKNVPIKMTYYKLPPPGTKKRKFIPIKSNRKEFLLKWLRADTASSDEYDEHRREAMLGLVELWRKDTIVSFGSERTFKPIFQPFVSSKQTVTLLDNNAQMIFRFGTRLIDEFLFTWKFEFKKSAGNNFKAPDGCTISKTREDQGKEDIWGCYIRHIGDDTYCVADVSYGSKKWCANPSQGMTFEGLQKMIKAALSELSENGEEVHTAFYGEVSSEMLSMFARK